MSRDASSAPPPRRTPPPLAQTLAALVVLGAGLGVAGYLVATAPEPARRPRTAPPPVVETLLSTPTDFRVTVRAWGTVDSAVRTVLAAEVAGPLAEIAPVLEPGRHVAAGTLLARIDPAPYRIAVAVARAELAAARARLREEQARAEQARRDWAQLGREPPGPLAVREPQLARARAEVEAAEARLRRTELELARTEIRAPYAARILARRAGPGQYLAPGTPVAEIHSLDALEVRLPLSRQELALLELPATGPGPAVRLTGPEGGVWRGRIVRTEPAVDGRTREVVAVARIADAADLRLGELVAAEIEGRLLRGVHLLPRTALAPDDRVAVVDDDGRLRRRAVTVAWRGETQVAVRGLAQGARVVLTPVAFLPDGAAVRVAGAAP